VALIAPCVSSSYVDFFSYSLASDGESLSSGLLLGEAGSLLIGLLNAGGLLVALEFDMAVAGKVGRNSTMGSVSASSSGDGSLADGVVDNASVDVESLLLSVSSQVLEERLNGLDGLLGPSSKLVLEDLALGVSTDTTGVHSEGNDGFFSEASVHVLDGFIELKSLACSGNIVRVLVMDSQVSDLAYGGFGGLSGLSRVFDHCKLIPIY